METFILNANGAFFRVKDPLNQAALQNCQVFDSPHRLLDALRERGLADSLRDASDVSSLARIVQHGWDWCDRGIRVAVEGTVEQYLSRFEL